MKHINLTSWKGSITDWTELNYIKGGLPDYYADIANVEGNYLRYSNNLLDITKSTYQGYINQYGELTPFYNWAVSEYINISNITTFTIKSETNLGANGYLQYYDIDKNAISVELQGEEQYKTFTKPDNAYYVRISFRLNENWMVVSGSTAPTTYEPYGRLVIEKNRVAIPVGQIDVSNWIMIWDENYRRMYTDISSYNVKLPANNDELVDVYIPNYNYVSVNEIRTNSADYLCSLGTTGNLVIRNKEYTDSGNMAGFLAAYPDLVAYVGLATPEIVVVPEFVVLYKYYGYHNVIQNGILHPDQGFSANLFKVEAGKSYKISNGTSNVRAFYTADPIPDVTHAYNNQRIVEDMTTNTPWTAPIDGYVSVRSANFKIECLYVE